MADAHLPLPSFQRPPVVEVSLSTQFDAVEGLTTPLIGALWAQFRTQFPRTEDHGSLEPVFEMAEPVHRVESRVQLLDRPELRVWFLNESGTELIQVQRDRFIHNWRKTGDHAQAYPRYPNIRASYKRELEQFVAFLKDEGLGDLRPNQCEVSYVNVISIRDADLEIGDLGQAFSFWHPNYTIPDLGSPEDARAQVRFRLLHEDNIVGRLHVTVEPRIQTKSKEAVFFMTLTARGVPRTPNIEGALDFLDFGRQKLVKAFCDLTTKKMHAHWGRENDQP